MTHYRPDIDGLRALAVLAVIGFHAFPGRIPGGFVGVDIFFVISGYLITSIIYADIVNGKFSIVEFYARRIRRIFPALICVLLAALALGWLVLFPEEYSRLAMHVIGGSYFYSNLLLWSEAGYFDVEAQVKPLLHLWSLGVEEQYYLLWPVALLGIWAAFRNHARAGMAIVAFAGISFALNVVFIADDSTAVFYSPSTRIWELLIGAVLAVGERSGRLFPRPADAPANSPGRTRLQDAVSVAGALLIAGSIALVGTRHPFPGWIALAPTLGAAFMIAAGPGARLNLHVLSSRPAVFIGLISYPLYLWHWPLLSFAHIYEPEVYSPIAEATNTGLIRILKVAAVLVAFIAAILTYQLIEKRIRKLAPRPIAIKLFATISLIAALGGGIFLTEGLASIRGPIDGPAKSKLMQPAYLDCTKENGAIFNAAYSKGQPTCEVKAGSNARLDILVFGDSHGMDFYRGIENANLSIGLFEAEACMPFAGFEKDAKGSCSKILKRFMELVDSHKPATIVISLYFSRFYLWHGKEQNLNAQARETFKRLSALSDLIVMLDIPILTFNPDNCRSRPIKHRIDCVIPKETYAGQRKVYEKGLRDAAAGIGNMTFVDPERLFCSGTLCYGAEDNILLYRDTHHLTNEGSVILGNWFWESYSKRPRMGKEMKSLGSGDFDVRAGMTRLTGDWYGN